jgi:uncharacterized protein
VTEVLSEAEIERLAARLSSNQNANALTLEGVDGLFCALIASPTMIGPSGYLPVILGGEPEESEAFADLKDANDTLSLLMRYWNSIVADFRDETVHLPYIEEPGTDNIPGRDWARGFMRGTRLAANGWTRLFSDDQEGLPVTIALAAGEIDPEWPKEPLTKEKGEELLQSMFAGAARAYRYFEADRKSFAESGGYDASFEEGYPETYVRPERKVGRNEPCPCGSGKKFKKCCGSATIGPLCKSPQHID